MLRRVILTPLAALPLGIGAVPAVAQTTPAPVPTTTPSPEATKAALLAFGLIVADVQYEPGGTDGAVAVTLFGPPHPEMPDQIAAVVWATEPLRFSNLVVRWTPGQVVRTYPDLLAQFGPRPSGFDRSTVLVALLLGSGPWSLGFEELGRFFAVVLVVAVVFVSLIVVLFVWLVLALLIRRRRRLTGVA